MLGMFSCGHAIESWWNRFLSLALGRTYYLNIDFVYIKYVGHKLNISHRHFFWCVYDLSQTKFHVLNPYGPLVVSIKPKAKYRLWNRHIVLYST